MAAWLTLLLLAASIDTGAGDRMYAAGEFAQAAGFYRDLLTQFPGDPKLLVRLGAAQYQMGSFAEAEKHFRMAVTKAPGSAQAEVGLGMSLLALNHAEKAVPVLERALKLAPSDRMALRALGHAYQKQNDLFRGEQVLESLVREDPKDAESWYYLGTLLYDNNYYARALGAFEHTLELRPSDSQTQISLAGALTQMGRTAEAGDLYRSLTLQPDPASRPELWLGYAQFLFEDQQLESSLQAVNHAISLLPDSAKLLFWRARILMSLGKTEDAEADAQKAVQLSPDLPNAHNLLMKLYRAGGRTKDADEQAAWLAQHTKNKKAGQP
jgi:tetratricopeptide (TPR) repeat protein